MYTESTVAKAKTLLSVAASIGASAMLVRSIARELFPDEMEAYFYSNIRSFFRLFSSQLTLVIDEFDGLVSNQIYEAAEVYLGSKVSPSTQRIKVSKPEMEKNFNITIERNEEIVDCFNGVKYKWMLVCRQIETKNFYNPRDLNSTLRSEVRSFELSFHKKHKDKVLNSYLPYIVNESKSMKEEKKTLKIFTVDPENIYNMADAWVSVNLDHPATFDTIAMETKMKETILEDLERFVRRKDFYRKVGKAWKRGYLLYGPPGTGKSSLIAAMANYLKFDIYDLELTSLRNNSDLRRLLVVTANRSILVVEDIDCSIKLEDRSASVQEPQPPWPHENQSQVTLSGILNFIDGLWSSCGDERIIVFTTNHKEKLDPALLRPGRMDMHIHMSYCTPCGFKLLTSNYLKISNHILFKEIEELIQSTKVTPAEVAEQLMKSEDPDIALGGLVEFLKQKIMENEKAKETENEKETEKVSSDG